MAETEDEQFEALVRRQSRFVFRVAYAILRNSHDAEDAAQETFLKLYRNQRWKGMNDERAFLARTVWRVAVDRLPKREIQEIPVESEDLELISVAASPEQEAISGRQQAAIHRMIDALPEDLRQPLALSGMQELSSREVAVILGIPEGTVRTRLMRARQMLRQKLETVERSSHA